MTFWRRLPPAAQAAAAAWLPRVHPQARGLRILTYSEWSPDGRERRAIEVGDPAWIAREPGSWRWFCLLPEPRDYEFAMMKNAVATRDRWRWEIKPGAHAGAVVHVVANGPSAADLAAAPGDVVVAVNGARALVRPDYWFLADPGYVGGPAWVARMAALAAADPAVPGVMSPGSPPELAALLRETHWFLPASGPGPTGSRFYRHLVPEGARLPSFVTGRQTVVAALHFAWWVLGGAGEVRLWGVDLGCAARPDSLAAYYAGAHAPGGAELHLADDWFPLAGHGWTTPELLGVSRAVDAMAAFLRDDGLRVVQHRRRGCGVRLALAEVAER